MGAAAEFVTGYHGTSRAAADKILSEGFAISNNEYDWLGDGTYFFQDVDFPHSAREHALAWARRLDPIDAFVLEARIDLTGCMDLLRHGWSSRLRRFHEQLATRAALQGVALPRQAGGNHGLDRLLINYAAGVLEDAGSPVRSVRACFGEDSRPAFPGSSLFDLTHVQIAVRDLGVLDRVREA